MDFVGSCLYHGTRSHPWFEANSAGVRCSYKLGMSSQSGILES
jgi:hypothetical protein